MNEISEKEVLYVLDIPRQSFVKRYINTGLIKPTSMRCCQAYYNICDIVDIAITNEYRDDKITSIGNIIKYLKFLDVFRQIKPYKGCYLSDNMDISKIREEHVKINATRSENSMICTDGFIKRIDEREVIVSIDFNYIVRIELDVTTRTVICDLTLNSYNIVANIANITGLLNLCRKLNYSNLCWMNRKDSAVIL